MEHEEAQREWRQLILTKLQHLEDGQNRIQQQFQDLLLKSVSIETVTKLEERIRVLELFKERALMLFFVIQGLMGVAGLILNHYWK